MTEKTPKSQGKNEWYGKPPVERQFGKPNGNKQGHGFWKKEDTPRFKLERMITLGAEDLQTILDDPKASKFEQDLARILLDMPLDQKEHYDASSKWRILADMINQVYGQPKQEIKTTLETPTPLVDLTKRTKNGKDNSTK